MSNVTHEVLTGTCACCLGRFVVDGQEPVLHGYKRPGDGQVHGRCDGINFPAYEISTAGSVHMRDSYKQAAASQRSYAGMVANGQVNEIKRSYTDYSARKSVSVTIVFTPDSAGEDFRKIGYWTWAELVKSEVHQAVRSAEGFERKAKTFQDAINTWKPGLTFISEDRLNAQKVEARDEKARLVAQKRRFKALKTAFFNLGAAINKHKKGWLHAEWDREMTSHSTDARWANITLLAPFSILYPQLKKKK